MNKIDLTTAFIRCRTYGHSWDEFRPMGATREANLTLRCTRCMTVRYDIIDDATGDVVKRRLRVPVWVPHRASDRASGPAPRAAAPAQDPTSAALMPPTPSKTMRERHPQSDTEAGVFPCDQADCDRVYRSPQALGRHKSTVHAIAGAGRTSRRKKPAASTDEIIVVLDVLCPKGVPARYIPLVNQWVESTREMLKVVRG